MTESFGIMDQGYFVPRTQILYWLNNLLQLNLTKIQQLGAGSVYCQVIDVIHDGKIALNKVNWRAKTDYQFINNFKVLQNAFEKIGIKKYIEVQKLSKAKYQDNLQFIQWLKRYYDVNGGDRSDSYDAKQRRGNVIPDFSFAEKNVLPKTYNGGGIVISQTKTCNNIQSKSKRKEDNQNELRQVSNRIKDIVSDKKPTRKIQTHNGSKVTELQSKLDNISKIVNSKNSAQRKLEQIQGVLGIEHIKLQYNNSMNQQIDENHQISQESDIYI